MYSSYYWFLGLYEETNLGHKLKNKPLYNSYKFKSVFTAHYNTISHLIPASPLTHNIVFQTIRRLKDNDCNRVVKSFLIINNVLIYLLKVLNEIFNKSQVQIFYSVKFEGCLPYQGSFLFVLVNFVNLFLFFLYIP